MSEIVTIVNEDQPAYFDKAEMEQLRDALKRSYAERFRMMAELMKMNLMFRRAKITHSQSLSKGT